MPYEFTKALFREGTDVNRVEVPTKSKKQRFLTKRKSGVEWGAERKSTNKKQGRGRETWYSMHGFSGQSKVWTKLSNMR